MNSYASIRQQREPPPSSPVGGAAGDSPIVLQYRFLEKFRRGQENMWNKQSIYRIPTLVRKIDPKAYEPRVVSIGPYHYGKEELEPMDEHKHRALKHYLKTRSDHDTVRFDDVLAGFREEGFLEKVMNSYAKPLDQQWCDDYAFLHLMVLDGCFVLELLLSASGLEHSCPGDPPSEWCYTRDDPIFGVHARHGIVPYLKMDMLLLENQIPLIVLEKLARLANMEVDINKLIWSFYDCNHRHGRSNFQLGLHVLDVYRKGRISYGDYNGWTVPKSAKELDDFGIRFLQSSGGGSGDGFVGIGSFKDVAFEKGKDRDIFSQIYDHFMEPIVQRQPPLDSNVSSGWFSRVVPLRLIPSLTWRFPCARRTTEWYVTSIFLWIVHFILASLFYVTTWWYLPLWVTQGKISLPVLTIDETTTPIFLNLMAFERLHLGREGRDMTVTHYVFLMSSLVRSKNDVEHLRKTSVLSCVPGRSDKSVVKLFADVTKNMVLDDRRGVGTYNQEIEALCERLPNKWQATWLRHYGSDLKTWIVVILTGYGVALTFVNTLMAILNYIVVSNRKPVVCT